MASKRPHIQKVLYNARQRGLFMMASGEGHNFKYEFWNKKSGKLVLTYYQESGRWLSGQRDGKTANYLEALVAALDRST